MSDKTGLAVTAVTGAAGVIIGALITAGVGYLSHRGDSDAKMTEVAIGILQAKPNKETAPLREWAIDVIDKRAKFSLNEAQRAVLVKTELPPVALSPNVRALQSR